MSLESAGVWAVGVWATTVWADGVWFEAEAEESTPSQGGFGFNWNLGF